MIFLRPATLEDATFLYRLRTDPVTRAMSFTDGPTSLAAHVAWLYAILATHGVALYVAERGGVPVGTGRLDYLSPEDAEVSITLAPEARGRGYAAPLLRAIQEEARRLGYRRLVAEIKGSNVASLRAFLSVGYASTEDCVRVVRRVDGSDEQAELE